MMFALLLSLGTAHAIDVRWWGVGPTVGTQVLPTAYPVAFPAAVREDDGTTAVDKVRGDVELGVHAVMYPGTAGRLWTVGTIGLGTSKWVQPELVLGYDVIAAKDADFQFLLGAGLGAGHERFNNPSDDSYLKVNYFPFRANMDVLLRDKVRAYELGLWGEYHIPTLQQYCDATGETCIEGKGDATVAGAVYLALGAEATLYFGDFRNKDSGSKDNGSKDNGGKGGRGR